MSLTVQSDTPPIHLDASGAYRVGDSRVLLEMVIEAFEDGATPESIVQDYSTLKLSEVYAVIAHYLRHRGDVAGYLQEREELAIRTQQKIEARQGDLATLLEGDYRRSTAGMRQSQRFTAWTRRRSKIY